MYVHGNINLQLIFLPFSMKNIFNICLFLFYKLKIVEKKMLPNYNILSSAEFPSPLTSRL